MWKTVELTLKLKMEALYDLEHSSESILRGNRMNYSESYLNSNSIPMLLSPLMAWKQLGCPLANKWLSCKFYTHRGSGSGGDNLALRKKILSWSHNKTLNSPLSFLHLPSVWSTGVHCQPSSSTLSFHPAFNPCTLKLNLYSHTKVLSWYGSSYQSSQTPGGWDRRAGINVRLPRAT